MKKGKLITEPVIGHLYELYEVGDNNKYLGLGIFMGTKRVGIWENIMHSPVEYYDANFFIIRNEDEWIELIQGSQCDAFEITNEVEEKK